FMKCQPMSGIICVTVTVYPSLLARARFVAYFAVATRALARNGASAGGTAVLDAMCLWTLALAEGEACALHATPARTMAAVAMTPTSEARSAMSSPSVSWDRRHGVRTDDHRVGDLDDLVDRELGGGGVAADGLGAFGLVYADGADRAIRLFDDVAPCPCNHLRQSHGLDGGTIGRLVGIPTHRPRTPPHHPVRLHLRLLGSRTTTLRLRACCLRDIGRSAQIAGRSYPSSSTSARLAAATASPRVRASSLRRIAETWWSTVFSERTRCSAIWALRSPSASRVRTSSSRAVSPAGFSRVLGRGPRGTPRAPRSRRR